MLFTCIKSRFFRNHLANFHQISHWSFCWMWLIVYSNDHAPLTVRPIYSSSKLRTAQMMIFSLVAMIGLEKCCITSACLQWLCHSGERIVARGPLVTLGTLSIIKNRVHSITWKPLKISSWNFIWISINIRQHAKCKNHNSCLYTFWVIYLGISLVNINVCWM